MPQPSRPLAVPSCLLLAIAGTLAAVVPTASGQFRVRRGMPMRGVDPTADGAAHDDKDAPVGVTVPDSPGAMERLGRAAEKEQQKQWKTAADFYREAVTQFAGRVVPSTVDKAAGTFRYTGVAAAVQERIAKWPPEGLAVYRNLYGPAAADRLAAAPRGDLAALLSIFYDDFVTDAGKAAGVRLVDAYTEAGDFPAAAAVGDRLLDLHPLLGGDRPAVLFRTALADHWAGDDAAANKRLADLRRTDAKAVGTVGGKDVVLADALATALAVPAPAPAVDPLAADTYPSFGGPGGRGDVSPSRAKPGASLTPVLLAKPDFSAMAGPQQKNWVEQDKVSKMNGGVRGIIPAVDAGTLFFQDGRTVYAVDADSGMAVTPWLATYPGEAGGRYHLAAPGRARGEELTVTVTPSSVLAVMGQRDRAMYGNAGMFNAGFVMRGGGDDGGGAASPVRLVCLDRATGRERWKVSAADLPDAAGAAKTAEYGGTPLSVPAAVAGTPDDAVLVVARGGRDGQFDNCYVVCLSARTGQYRWSTYVGSGTRSFDGETMFAQDPSQLSLADGRAFVMSNLGTVAALDPADGRVLWLTAYARDNAENLADLMARQNMGGNAGPSGPSRPWSRNPVVVQGGHVFALPTDAKSLMVLDAATGKEVRRIDTSLPTNLDGNGAGQHETADVLLGVHDGYAVLTGDHTIFGVNWRKYAPDDPAASLWIEQPWGSADTDTNPATKIAARGFLTADGIYMVNQQNLSEIDWRRHKIVAVYPATGAFSGGQGPGNILVTSQNVVVAGDDRVDVYTELGVVQAKYDREMRTAPTDPRPRVRFATALFAGGQTTDALARMDEAIGLVGGQKSMRPGPDRQMIFNVLLDFANRLSQPVPTPQSPDEKTRQLADALFDRAADAADGPDQRVAYLLARGRFDHDVTHDYAAEVDLCQRVLADGALRRVAVTDEQTGAAAATADIASAITADRASYAPVETRATAALADARTHADPDALLAVADVYPNSHAAADALRAAAKQYEAAGKPARAIDVRRQMYAAAGDPLLKGAVLEAIAADFLATGPAGVGPATDRLARAGQLSPDPHLATDLTLPDGTVLHHGDATYADAVTSLRATLAAADAAKLPDFRLSSYKQAVAQYKAQRHGAGPVDASLVSPFLPGPAVISDVLALVHPARAFDRTDRVMAWTTAGLAVFDAGQTTPRFRTAGLPEAPAGAAWVGDAAHGRWVVWTPTTVTALADDGHPAWPAAVAVRDLPPDPAVASGGSDVVVDDVPGGTNDGDVANQQAVINGQIINIRVAGGGRRAFVIQGNRLVPAPVAPAAGAAVVLGGGERIIAAEPAGPTGDVLVVTTSTGRLAAIDTAAGKVLWQSRPADRPADAVMANGHFTVARLDDAGGATVVVYDTPTGRVVGRRKFTADGSAGQLVNVALGEEGTLALTLLNTVEVKDLYDPWKLPPTPLVARANADNAGYAGMSQPDQLLVRAGRVVTLYDAGRYVRAYDLSRPGDPTNPLRTAAASPNVWLRMDGPRLFVVQPAAVFQYNLSDPTDACTEQPEVNEQTPKIRGLLLGSDHAIAVHNPVDSGPVPSPQVTFMAFSRAPRSGTTRMSGRLDFCHAMGHSSGIVDYAGADGGVDVLLGNHKLVLLRGGRDAPRP